MNLQSFFVSTCTKPIIFFGPSLRFVPLVEVVPQLLNFLTRSRGVNVPRQSNGTGPDSHGSYVRWRSAGWHDARSFGPLPSFDCIADRDRCRSIRDFEVAHIQLDVALSC